MVGRDITLLSQAIQVIESLRPRLPSPSVGKAVLMKIMRSRVLLGKALLKKPRENILELAEVLSQVQGDGGFRDYCADIGIGQRRAYYLTEVMLAIRQGVLTKQDIEALGWTKCQLILAARVPHTQVGRIIRYAQGHTTKELLQYLKPTSGDNKTSLTLLVTKDEERRLRALLRELRREDRLHGQLLRRRGSGETNSP
jgi:hypothetical protein